MNPFTWSRAATAADAIAAGGPSAAWLAGGTTLVDLMKLGVERPEAVIDVNALPFAQISDLAGGGVRVGALVRNADMATDPRIARDHPMVALAIRSGASPQIRNMATTAGNLLQRTRCWYFRDTGSPCEKREPGTGCPAMGGDNHQHAVLGTSDRCIATHPSDLAVALVASDAVVQVAGPDGDRAIPIGDLHLLPGDHPERETSLEPGELITAVDLPPPWGATGATYLKVRDRSTFAFALASAAVAVRVEAGRIVGARIALGGVATRPWRAGAAEEGLIGQAPAMPAFLAAGEAAMAGAVEHGRNRYKIELGRRTVARALLVATGGA